MQILGLRRAEAGRSSNAGCFEGTALTATASQSTLKQRIGRLSGQAKDEKNGRINFLREVKRRLSEREEL